MTKRVQILGHDAATANAFIGLEREVTADTDNNHLVVHDGSTPGGHRILNRDENDNRYQARSVELDGLLGWDPNQRGILARQGPSNYDLIEITVDTDNLTITNGNAFGANPFIGFAATIASDHTWSGLHTFSQNITAQGGVTGDLIGNVTGDVTGDVTGNVTGNLTGDAAGDHTGTFTGGVTATSFSGAGTIHLADFSDEVNDALDLTSTFVGQITMYSGLEANIPDNWALCDGLNGTPDLRDKFIVCAGTTYPADSTGGAANHSHTATIDSGGAHTHTGTAADTALTIAQMPAHTHYNGVTDSGGSSNLFNHGAVAASPTTSNSIDGNTADGTLEGTTTSTGSGDPHNHTLSIDSGGAHSHTASTDSVGNLPPYYSLAFVMRIS